MPMLKGQSAKVGGASLGCRRRKKMSNDDYCGATSWAITVCDYCKSVDQVELLEINGITVRLCKECLDKYVKKAGVANCY